MEIWKDVGGYEGVYQVSNMGRTASLKFGKRRILKPRKDKDGYPQATLCRDGKRKMVYVHRLVAELFLGAAPSLRHEINHKNGDKADNQASNLEWVTHSENRKHSFVVLGEKAPRGEAHYNAKLTARKVRQIRKFAATGDWTQQELAERFGVCRPNISLIVNRQTWQHVP